MHKSLCQMRYFGDLTNRKLRWWSKILDKLDRVHEGPVCLGFTLLVTSKLESSMLGFSMLESYNEVLYVGFQYVGLQCVGIQYVKNLLHWGALCWGRVCWNPVCWGFSMLGCSVLMYYQLKSSRLESHLLWLGIVNSGTVRSVNLGLLYLEKKKDLPPPWSNCSMYNVQYMSWWKRVNEKNLTFSDEVTAHPCTNMVQNPQLHCCKGHCSQLVIYVLLPLIKAVNRKRYMKALQ